MVMGTRDIPDTPFGRLDKTYHVLETALNYVAGGLIFILMIVACAEVLMRKLFNSPIHGQADLVEIMIPTMGFFGLAYCQRLAGHVRMELLVNQLKGRAYWLFEFTSNFATILIVALMMWGTWGHFMRAFELGDTTMDAEFQVWPPKLIIFIGFCMLLGRCLIAFFGYIRLLRTPDAVPIGVPVSPTIHEIAEQEAEVAREAISDEEVQEWEKR